jgi:hypothetical protein
LLLTALFYANQLNHHQVHGLLHLLGFDHELGKEAEEEMEKEEEQILSTLEWKGKGLIRSAYHFSTDMDHSENSDGRLPLHVYYVFLFLSKGLPSVSYHWSTSELLYVEANRDVEKMSLREGHHQPKLTHIVCDIDGELM